MAEIGRISITKTSDASLNQELRGVGRRILPPSHLSLLFLRPAVHPPTAVGFPLLCNQRDAQWLRIVNIIVTQTNGFGLTSRRGTYGLVCSIEKPIGTGPISQPTQFLPILTVQPQDFDLRPNFEASTTPSW